jgi:TPR repeat protein
MPQRTASHIPFRISKSFIMKFHPICLLALLMCLTIPAAPGLRAEGKSMDQLTAAADKGDAEAQYRLAQAYLLGLGAEKDTAKAFDYIRKAAEKGYPDAIGGLGYFHSVGILATKDLALAADYFRKGAEKGGPRSQVNLGRALLYGRGIEKNEAEGHRWIGKALELGLPYAHYIKGEFYFRGTFGHPKDYVKSREHLEKAAAADNAYAQNMLATIYYDGLGIRKDRGKAEYWFREAAAQGDPKGMANLGRLLGPDGPDASKHVEAMKWLLLADRANEPMARNILGEVLRTRPPEVMKEANRQMAEFKPRPTREHDFKADPPSPK